MALRRLLSGWLIAMAALARSVAQAVERASQDRSAPAPDPVMAALAERYPGAPAHWLAHVAERTSQLEEVGEAPPSLNTDPTAWPLARPDDLASPPSTQREAEPVSRDPRRPTPRRDPAVPTLAALNDRSSEVWRRSDVERPRRPRPVFAALAPAPTQERPVAASEPESATRRPRSPLTFVGSPSQVVSSVPEPMASEAPAKAVPREAVWSEAPSPPAPFDGTKAQPDAQGATERPVIDHAFSQARPRDVREVPLESYSDRSGPLSAARRQRSWFFAKSTRAGRSLEFSVDPAPHTEVERMGASDTIAIDPSPATRAAFPFSASDRAAVAPDRTWRAETPPAPRRSIFRALATLRAKSRPRADRVQGSQPAAKPAPSTDRPLPEPVPKRPPPSFTPSRAGSSARGAQGFQAIDLEAPSNPIEAHKINAVDCRAVRRSTIMRTANVESSGHDRRPTFAALRPSRSRPVSSRPVGPPSDDRWPSLPPSTITSPPGFEAPPPRWDQLAREQEEGRWSV